MLSDRAGRLYASPCSQEVGLFRRRHSARHRWHLFQRPSIAVSSLQPDPGLAPASRLLGNPELGLWA